MTMSGQKPWKVARAILVIVVSVAVIFGIGYQTWYTDQLRVRPPDYCPTGTWPQIREGFEVPGHTAILIDTSNEIPAEDAKLAFQRIDAWTRNSAPFLQRLSIFGLPESANDRVVRSFGSWCVPKDGTEANRIYENPVYVEAQFRRFLATLQDVFRELVGREESARSPIVETMAGLVQRNDDLDSIVLVSDMLQHTSLWSYYTMEGDTLSIPSECGRVTEPGRLKTVYVYFIDRGLAEIQAPEWPDAWWRRCLSGVKTEMLN
ncbi:MAG: hypothetical protein F4X19_00415 [Acidobacteria bacterium]|nr:hypothetical protein [Acidobacteriota bacterium]